LIAFRRYSQMRSRRHTLSKTAARWDDWESRFPEEVGAIVSDEFLEMTEWSASKPTEVAQTTYPAILGSLTMIFL
jgi:hypothetical protein